MYVYMYIYIYIYIMDEEAPVLFSLAVHGRAVVSHAAFGPNWMPHDACTGSTKSQGKH